MLFMANGYGVAYMLENGIDVFLRGIPLWAKLTGVYGLLIAGLAGLGALHWTRWKCFCWSRWWLIFEILPFVWYVYHLFMSVCRTNKEKQQDDIANCILNVVIALVSSSILFFSTLYSLAQNDNVLSYVSARIEATEAYKDNDIFVFPDDDSLKILTVQNETDVYSFIGQLQGEVLHDDIKLKYGLIDTIITRELANEIGYGVSKCGNIVTNDKLFNSFIGSPEGNTMFMFVKTAPDGQLRLFDILMIRNPGRIEYDVFYDYCVKKFGLPNKVQEITYIDSYGKGRPGLAGEWQFGPLRLRCTEGGLNIRLTELSKPEEGDKK